jgi:hypothetical protein
MADLEALINERFAWLCRVWPFPQISIRFWPTGYLASPEANPCALPFLGENWDEHLVSFSATEVNPYYRHHLHLSVSEGGKDRQTGIHAPGIAEDDKPSRGYLTVSEIRGAFERANQAITHDIEVYE